MSFEDAIRAAARMGLTVRFDKTEVSEDGGFGVSYEDANGDPAAAFVKLRADDK